MLQNTNKPHQYIEYNNVIESELIMERIKQQFFYKFYVSFGLHFITLEFNISNLAKCFK